ncbi:MAG: tetratricopeptide repeat protein [Candidatus Obscuribacterales bacterium]|nr:tetratricopeptide repeat protein [Candidatus Obscuribacterales bacterium]
MPDVICLRANRFGIYEAHSMNAAYRRFTKQLPITTLALSVAFSLLPANAQIPGVPGTGSYPNSGANTAPTPSSNNQILSGQVKTDIAPAEKALAEGKYADAEGMFRELLVNNPQDLQATVGLGLSLAKQFKLDGADDLFDRVLGQDPNNALAFAGKATVLLNRMQSSAGTIRANRDSYLKQAEQYAQQACRLQPAGAEGHLTLGLVYKEEGQTDQAASELRTAIQFDPNQSYAYSGLGTIKLDQKSLGEAVENFKRAIELNSGNSQAHFGLGAAYSQLGQLDDAIKELNTSLYQFPNSWPTRMELGKAYAKQGNTVAAMKEFQLSTLIKPENVEPYLAMADIHQERGDNELALADLRSGLTQAPYNLDLRQRIADITLRLEKPDDAIKAYKTILQMSPNNPSAIKGLSQALYMKAQKAAVGALLASNDYESALKTLDDAIQLNPNDMELRLSKAKLMSLSGTKPDLSTMGQPGNDGERIAYAQALMANGEFIEASNMMKTVLMNVADAKQTFAVADIALMMHDLDNAQAAYNKALTLSGAPERGKRGLDAVAAARKTAQDSTTVGNELLTKKQWDGAVERFRQALAANPMQADAHYGLGQALEKTPKASSSMLLEAVVQYQNYLLLKTDLTAKDKANLVKNVDKLTDKAAKLKQKEDKTRK